MDEKTKAAKNFSKSLSECLREIPESVLQMFLEASIKDAQKLFETGEVEGDFKQVTYMIYRAYVLGVLFKESIEETKEKDNKIELIRKDDNIIYMNFKATP